MKGIKNSLKKLSLNRSNSKTVIQTTKESDVLVDKNIKRTTYLESFPKVLFYKDYELPGDLIHPKVLDDLQDFDIRENDIFIVSYPQSGSSLIEEIIVQIVNKYYEKKSSLREAQVAKLEVAQPYGHLRWLKGLKSPRILTTNLPFSLIPDSVKNAICKIIYFVRNPKDQAISYYYQHRVKQILYSFDDFIELYMRGQLLYGDYFSHVIDFWQLSRMNPKNCLFVSFEEIKLKTEAMIQLIVNFLGYDMTNEEIRNISNNLPKKSQTIENYNTCNVKQSNFEGVIGDWLNYFSPEQNRQMDELIRNRFGKLGLSMCFDPIEAIRQLSKFGRIIVDTNGDKNNIKLNNRKNTTIERPKLAKHEFLLLRNKSLNEMEMYSIEGESEPTVDGCCAPKLLRMCCPCLYKNIDYTNI